MKNLNLSRYALSVYVAAILLAGCGGSSGTSPQSNAIIPSARLQRLELTRPAHGGAFSATYSGTNHRSGSCLPGRAPLRIKFRGPGNASYLHRSRERGKITFEGGPQGMCGSFSGKATLTSSGNRLDSINMRLSGYPSEGATYTVIGGTGKFANATGTGTVIFQYLSGYEYSYVWSGTLYY